MKLRYIIAGVLIALAGYGLVKASPLLMGPEIRIDPTEVDSEQGFITLSGRALHTEKLTLNGATLLIDEQGYYSKDLTLPRGSVYITLKANDRFGRNTSVTRQIVVP